MAGSKVAHCPTLVIWSSTQQRLMKLEDHQNDNEAEKDDESSSMGPTDQTVPRKPEASSGHEFSGNQLGQKGVGLLSEEADPEVPGKTNESGSSAFTGQDRKYVKYGGLESAMVTAAQGGTTKSEIDSGLELSGN